MTYLQIYSQHIYYYMFIWFFIKIYDIFICLPSVYLHIVIGLSSYCCYPSTSLFQFLFSSFPSISTDNSLLFQFITLIQFHSILLHFIHIINFIHSSISLHPLVHITSSLPFFLSSLPLLPSLFALLNFLMRFPAPEIR